MSSVTAELLRGLTPRQMAEHITRDVVEIGAEVSIQFRDKVAACANATERAALKRVIAAEVRRRLNRKYGFDVTLPFGRA